MQCAWNIELTGKPEWKEPVGQSTPRWKDTIKTYLKKVVALLIELI
jgi:hypothetical protein